MIKFSNYEVSKIHVIEHKIKFSGNEQLKSSNFSRNHGIIIESNTGDYDDRTKMKEKMPKHHRPQFFHNCSISELNDGMHSVENAAKFHRNVLIYFPTTTVLQTCMLLMKEMTNKYFKWTLDDGADDRSYSIPIMTEGDSECDC